MQLTEYKAKIEGQLIYLCQTTTIILLLARIRLLGRFTVVVCSRLAFHASGNAIFLEIFEFKIFLKLDHYDDVIIQ